MLDCLLLLVYQRQPFQNQNLLSMLNEPGVNFLPSLCSWAGFIGNPECRFCRAEAHVNEASFIGMYIKESLVNFEIIVPGVKDAIVCVLSSEVGKTSPRTSM